MTKATAREIAERAGLIVLDPDDEEDIGHLESCIRIARGDVDRLMNLLRPSAVDDQGKG